MITSGRGPIAKSVSITTRAWVSELSLIWIFQVATDSVVPDVAGGITGEEVEAGDTVTRFRLTSPLSNNSVICCVPEPRLTGMFTVVHVCQPPVLGMLTVVHTSFDPLKPICILAPLGVATR